MPKITPGHIKGSPYQIGPLIAKSADSSGLAAFKENKALLRALNKKLKLFRGEDGWFAKGKNGQVWEYGVGKLGFTVASTIMINNSILMGFKPTQRGDAEANFSCEWSNENITKLIRLLRLRIRRESPMAV